MRTSVWMYERADVEYKYICIIDGIWRFDEKRRIELNVSTFILSILPSLLHNHSGFIEEFFYRYILTWLASFSFFCFSLL